MEVTELTRELGKVKEDLGSALQENVELHSQIEMLQAKNEQMEHDLRLLRVLVNMFKGHADDIFDVSDSE